MPLIPEEPQIHESAQGPRATASTPRPVPGPRSAASPRPGRPVPGPARPAAPAQRPTAGPAPADTPENRSDQRSTPQLQLIPAPVDGALDAAEEALDLLLESGRAPGDVLVLTTGDPHPWTTHELSFGEASYWAQQETGDDVFFAHATALERATARPVVIVALNGGDDETAAKALPSAMARAGALLVVCGDPQRVTTLLGAGAGV
ncbi:MULTISPECIES: hypothetical protein [unclassified Streptomyces]|uniref:hypothetical protein n=1 Tax=unclassified Streptomyces TaxID=2593676 RepID=UPI0007005D9D|nr:MULTISPECIES: hypothetical protein [unclassified Streptomyces]KQX56185.1 hypothetical protein ASD33_29450 [Streptomyces sp. Root1304]KRA97001.1 hypothetical protein ASE09_26260 [Streptomyces sp. Root66D1]